MLLLDFPAEILSDICEHLSPSQCPYCDHPRALDQFREWLPGTSGQAPPDPESYRSSILELARLCSVSKALRSIATPMLYHHFVDIPEDKNKKYGWSNRNLFLRALNERPELCNQVRQLHFHWIPRGHGATVKEPDISIMARLAKRLNRTLPEAFVAEGSIDYQRKIMEVENLFSELLLALCPNVQEIILSVSDYGFKTNLLHQRPLSLQKLRSLTFLGPDGGGSIQDSGMVDDINGLSKIAPNLSRLSAVSCPWINLVGENITVLDFTECVVSANRLRSMISACKALEKFNYESGVRFHTITSHDSAPEVTPRQAAAALAKHKRTLTFLQLDFAHRTSQEESDPDYPIETLRDFTALKTLRIDGLCLYSWTDGSSSNSTGNLLTEFLPPQIKLFMVIQAHEHLFGDAENFVRQIPQHFRHLEEFGFAMNVSVDNHWRHKRTGMQKALQSACEEIEVKFRWRSKCFSWEQL